MNDDPAYTVDCAGIQDINAMLCLEKTYFDNCWQSEATEIKDLIRQEPMMFRVCKVKDEVKGFYWVFPLSHNVWQKVITGQMDEDEMVRHIKSFSDPNLYLYISSVIVDQADKSRKRLTKELVYDFGRNFVLQKHMQSNIKAVGAFTISAGGKRLMERSDFSYKGSFKAGKTMARSYVISLQKLVEQALKIRRQRQILHIA